MINEDQLHNVCTQIKHEAWRVGTNTTMNDILEYCLKEYTSRVLIPFLEGIYEELDQLGKNIEQLSLNLKDEVNASNDGGLQKPKGDEETLTKQAGPKARKVA